MLLAGCTTKHSPAKAPDISMNQAVYDGNIEIINQHLSFDADINTKDAGGWSPLHWAVGEGHEKIIKLLLAKKADVNAIDQTGKTPLDYALLNKKKETAVLLRVSGAKTAKELKKNEIEGHEKKAQRVISIIIMLRNSKTSYTTFVRKLKTFGRQEN